MQVACKLLRVKNARMGTCKFYSDTYVGVGINFIYIYSKFFLHSRVATLTISIPSGVCSHTHLSL
jgi:hypothetical protein